MHHLEHGHSKKEIAKRLNRTSSQNFLRDWIYGGIDGTVTTFAVISGVVGGKLSAVVILILGFANLLADGFSMAAGNYLGTKSEVDQYQHFNEIEKKHIATIPEGEKEEIRQIFRNKGIQGETLDEVVKTITGNKELWISTMLREEYGLPAVIRSPKKAALYTFLSFLFFGFIPLIPYVLTIPYPFLWSCVLTGITFFVIGSIKSYWSLHSWWYSGLETFSIGAITAGIAYIIGYLLHHYLVAS